MSNNRKFNWRLHPAYYSMLLSEADDQNVTVKEVAPVCFL